MFLVFANQKGGVGKTTLAVNTASAMAALGKKTVAIDCDPQFALSRHFNVSPTPYSLVDVLTNDVSPLDAVVSSENNVDVICSARDLSAVETGLVTAIGREFILRNALQPLAEVYDVIVLDSPPNLGLLTVNALITASCVISPVSAEDEGALHGLAELLKTIDLLERLSSRKPATLAVLNKYDQRRIMTNATTEALDGIGIQIAKTRIPARVAFQHMKANRKPTASDNTLNELFTSLVREIDQVFDAYSTRTSKELQLAKN